VRLVKVVRNRDGTQNIIQYNVELLLEGDAMDSAFLVGDNSTVVPTDTCKNTVYCVASQNEWSSMEEFGLLICKHFLNQYPQTCNKITVTIYRDNWDRLTTPDSRGMMKEHAHAFRRTGPIKPFTICIGEKRPTTNMSFSVSSGFKNLEICKTTMSGFVGYPKDRYTSLPESTDRIVGTSADAQWTYNKDAVNRGKIDYVKAFDKVCEACIYTFAGPADKGVYSKSVQETLYQMSCESLKKVDTIDEVSMEPHAVSF
jgi:urate oxidase